jgi:hypothetical protein
LLRRDKVYPDRDLRALHVQSGDVAYSAPHEWQEPVSGRSSMLAKMKRRLLPVDNPATRAMFLADGRQVGTGALLGALFGQRHALPLGTRHFARSHRFDAAAGMVVDAVDCTRKLEGSLLQQSARRLSACARSTSVDRVFI